MLKNEMVSPDVPYATSLFSQFWEVKLPPRDKLFYICYADGSCLLIVKTILLLASMILLESVTYGTVSRMRHVPYATLKN